MQKRKSNKTGLSSGFMVDIGERKKQKFYVMQLEHEFPIVTTAIHDGHLFSENLKQISALSDSERLREEDPFTGRWTKISKNRIIANFSRFEVDLNRPREKCIYLEPEDAWGLNLWHTKPSDKMIGESLSKYDNFYNQVGSGLKRLLKGYERIVVLDLHSYNHRRQGPDKPADDSALNPEVNIGTGSMDRSYWSPVVERFIDDVRNYNYFERSLDIRENIKFKGGYFSRWLHDNFPQKICCLSIEFKKFFMDEWTGEPEEKQINEIKSLLNYTLPGILDELEKM
jgi:N-formylglutamate amidohydrolase